MIMRKGKIICKKLREIREKIAEANDIHLVTTKCHSKGDCSGTCLKCEAEVRYLEEQLRARSLAGKPVRLTELMGEMRLKAVVKPTPVLEADPRRSTYRRHGHSVWGHV